MESAVASERFQLMLGDCFDGLKELPPESVDAIVTDPPYGLEFMGKEWDTFKVERRKVAGTGGTQAPFAHHAVKLDAERGTAFQTWCHDWATECLRVLKPGGHLLAFGGSRTYHRLGSAIEDSVFEIRYQILWLYGQGFPK
jgi:site-specific DNA-methyltransferase (adenine-specific)